MADLHRLTAHLEGTAYESGAPDVGAWPRVPYRRLRVGRMVAVSDLADAVLPLIRTRADLSRWSASNEHGAQMHEAVDILEAAAATGDPADVYAVTHQALASAIKVIARADDSSGIIGDACRRLLGLHPGAAARAGVPAPKLVAWMIKFQFDGEVDYFELDPVAYAPALGETGMAMYRARLDEIAADLGPEPTEAQERDIWEHRWSDPQRWDRLAGQRVARHTVEWNQRRLAVLDRDVEAIIRTHARDRKVAAWLQQTAESFEEIGEIDLAIDWAKQATDLGPDHQSRQAAEYWCRLLATHRATQLLNARLEVFRRWPSSSTAASLHHAASGRWPTYSDEVMERLTASPRDAVLFTLRTLKDARSAWGLAHSLELADNRAWNDLVKAYEKVEPLAVLPVLARLAEDELVTANAQNYRFAARRLAKMRKLAAGTEQSTAVDNLIADLRETHRRRPRLQQEFDRAGLP